MLEFSQFQSAKDHKLSYSIAVISLIAETMFVVPLIIHYFKYKQGAAIETRYFDEIYDGFKDSKASKLYTSIFIIRRFMMASIIVFLRNANIWARCWIFMLVQASYLTYAIIVRPFEETKDNIIEIICEASFTFICIFITICNEESRWFKGLDQILIYSLMMFGLLISTVTLADFISNFIKKRKKKRSDSYLASNSEQAPSEPIDQLHETHHNNNDDEFNAQNKK